MYNALDIYRPKQHQNNTPQSWIDYTIDNNGIAVCDLVESYGYPSSDSRENLKRIVFAFINDFGEEAYYQLKQIHPDYRLFFPPKSPAREFEIIEQTQIVQEVTQPEKIQPTVNITEIDKDFFKKAIVVGLIIVGVVQILKVMPNART